MSASRRYQAYELALRRKHNNARIVTFRISRELNELISEAARRAGKSKSEFIRESIFELLKYLDGVGVKVELQSYTRSNSRRNHDSPVVLV